MLLRQGLMKHFNTKDLVSWSHKQYKADTMATIFHRNDWSHKYYRDKTEENHNCYLKLVEQSVIEVFFTKVKYSKYTLLMGVNLRQKLNIHDFWRMVIGVLISHASKFPHPQFNFVADRIINLMIKKIMKNTDSPKSSGSTVLLKECASEL